MIDKKGFCKLLDINIPEFSDFEYYIEQLSKLEKWKNIKQLVDIYEKDEEKYGDLFQLRIEKSNKLIDYIKNTRAFLELNDDNLIPDYPTTKNFVYDESKKYISIDIRKANWYVLKSYDPDFINELGDSYDGLLRRFGFPEIFIHSKSLRQYIFGNLNPKRQMKAQRVVIENLINKYKYLELEIACIKNDEVIYILENDNQLLSILSDIDSSVFNTKIFTVNRVDDFRIHTYYDNFGNTLYKEMVGCNGNLFYINLKKYILSEKIDIRDLYFRIDGNLAIWNYDGLKLELN